MITNTTIGDDTATATTVNEPIEATSSSATVAAEATNSSWEEKIQLVRNHYTNKGYRVHSGLQFGCELVLYADDPSKVHSDFCIHVVRDDGYLDWREIQTLVRSMSDFRKTLIIANVKKNNTNQDGSIIIEELAMTTEHKVKVKPKLGEVGSQRKRQKVSSPTSNNATTNTSSDPGPSTTTGT